jgi:hypothetical protein
METNVRQVICARACFGKAMCPQAICGAAAFAADARIERTRWRCRAHPRNAPFHKA